MTMEPGWFDAGVPGRERWWDGAAWTAHERDARPAAPEMGWYDYPGARPQVRWWNGEHWTGYSLRRDQPAADSFAVDPPAVGWAVGSMLLLFFPLAMTLSFAGFPLAGLAGGLAVLGVMFLRGGAQASRRRRTPAPPTAPIRMREVLPLPGTVDAPDAGWYRVSRAASRWWTGATWTHYISEQGRVRPTHFGPRVFRGTQVVTAIVGVAGLVVLAIAVFSALTASLSSSAAPGFIGVSIVLIVGALAMWASLGSARRLSLLPDEPPSPDHRDR